MTLAYRLNNLHFDYGNRNVLEINSLSIESRKITALIGPNGGGKSTLLAILAFLEQPKSGSLHWFGDPIDFSNMNQQRKEIALVPQNPYFLNGSVLYNIEIGLKLRGVPRDHRRPQALEALQNVECGDKAYSPVKSLSGGERQRVALARALALKSRILLFDEPFTYLDTAAIKTAEKIINWFVKEQQGTVVFSTHDKFHGMLIADEIVSLVNGRIADVPLVNLYSGELKSGVFDTGQICVHLPDSVEKASHISIDPNEIVLSGRPLVSSMRNCFEGRVAVIADCKGFIRITVDAKEPFEVLITHQALNEMNLKIGATVWINFKSAAVRIFAD